MDADTGAAAQGAQTDENEAAQALDQRLDQHIETVHDKESEGAPAYYALIYIQDELQAEGLPLDQDETYKLAGFEGLEQYRDGLYHHAMLAAVEEYNRARAATLTPPVITPDNLYAHSVNHYQSLLLWLRRAECPLLSSTLYKQLGVTRDRLMQEVQEAHIDAVKTYMALAQDIMVNGGDNEKGLEMMNAVIHMHIPALGIYGIDTYVQGFLGVSADDVANTHRYFCRKAFHTELLEACKHRLDRDGAAKYASGLSAAAAVLQKTSGIMDDPGVFAGTGMSKASFDRELDRTVEAGLRNLLTELAQIRGSSAELKAKWDELNTIRSLYGTVYAPDDAPYARRFDDYWMQHVFKDFGFETFTDVVDKINRDTATALVTETVEAQDISPVTAFENLREADDYLDKCYFPKYDGEKMDGQGIDIVQYREATIQCAQFAANHYWNQLFRPELDPVQKKNVISKLEDAIKQNKGYENLSFTEEQLADTKTAIAYTRIESLLLDYLAMLDSGIAQGVINEMFDEMYAAGLDISNEDVQRKLRITPEMAENLRQHQMVAKMSAFWREANNDNTEPMLALDLLVAIRDNIPTLTNTQLTLFLLHTGLKDIVTVQEKIRQVGTDIFSYNMSLVEPNRNDALKAAELMENAVKAVSAINASLLGDEIGFQRRFGIKLMPFMADYMGMLQRAADYTAPITPGFGFSDGKLARFGDVLLPENRGEKAVAIIDALAATLREEGKHILQPEVLAHAGFTPETFKAFYDENLYVAAQACIERAKKYTGQDLGLDVVNNHPFRHYCDALRHAARISGGTVMGHERWKKLGFNDRGDFVDHLRDQLIDTITQLESILPNPQLLAKLSPYARISILREINAAYEVLGMGPTRIPEAGDQTEFTTNAGNVDAMQRILIQNGPVAVSQILKDKSSASDKHKKLRTLLGFASQMKARNWDVEAIAPTGTHAFNRAGLGSRTKRANDAFESVVRQRIEGVLELYAKHRGSPARGAALALAIKETMEAHNLEERDWFIKGIRKLGFENVGHFYDYTACQRLGQITDILRNTHEMRSRAEMAKPEISIILLRHIERINTLSEDGGLIDHPRLLQLMDIRKLGSDWLQTMQKLLAKLALPALVETLHDPTLHVVDRWNMIAEVESLKRGLEGEEVAGKVDWEGVKALKALTAQQMAGNYLVYDLLRGDFHTLSEGLINAANTLGVAGLDFSDPSALPALELSETEAANLKDLNPLMPLYGLVSEFEESEKFEGNYLYNMVGFMIDEAAKLNLSIHETADLARFGVKDPATFVKKFDNAAVSVLKALANTATQFTDEPKRLQMQYKAMISFVDKTGIDKRFTPEKLKELGVPTRAELASDLDAVSQKIRAARKPRAAKRALNP
ncbi:MAG: hypothetical protein KGQ41_05145 [Alphaproteobacteria bacterium]|nr:hypothetical protein [Alphaproteobacteria bacterium]